MNLYINDIRWFFDDYFSFGVDLVILEWSSRLKKLILPLSKVSDVYKCISSPSHLEDGFIVDGWMSYFPCLFSTFLEILKSQFLFQILRITRHVHIYMFVSVSRQIEKFYSTTHIACVLL